MIKKIVLVVVLVSISVFLTGIGMEYKKFQKEYSAFQEELVLGRYETAQKKFDQLAKFKTLFEALKRLKAETYYDLSYNHGLLCFETGNFKEALASFSRAALSKNKGLREAAMLAQSTALWLSGIKNNPKALQDILNLYRGIISGDFVSMPSWEKREAVKRAYWIMARQAAGKKQSPDDKDSQKEGEGSMSEKKGKALEEAFKRIREQKPLSEGR